MSVGKIFKLAVIRNDTSDPCPFGLPIPFGCHKAGELISRMAPIDFLGDDSSDEERTEIANANKRLLMWSLSQESGTRCPYAGKLFEDKNVVECNFDTSTAGTNEAALVGSPFYYKHFSGIGMDGLYSYPITRYLDNHLDRGMYYSMLALESFIIEESNIIKKDIKND